jgi:twitching motility two-component system response regulator PilG
MLKPPVHIVVVDNTPTNRQILWTHLQRLGYRVTTYAHSGEALQVLLVPANPLPDMLIIDLNMPRIDGLTVIKTLRYRSRTLPILVLTARDGIIDKLKARLAGATAYMTKPYRVQEVSRQVNTLLGGKSF